MQAVFRRKSRVCLQLFIVPPLIKKDVCRSKIINFTEEAKGRKKAVQILQLSSVISDEPHQSEIKPIGKKEVD